MRSVTLHLACVSCVFSTLQGGVLGPTTGRSSSEQGGGLMPTFPIPVAGEAENDMDEKRSKRIAELGDTGI